jgi:peroxiredoxin
MRTFLLFLILLICCDAVAQAGKVLLNGTLSNLPQVRRVMLRTVGGDFALAAADVRDGQFSLSYHLEVPALAWLTFSGDTPVVMQHGVGDKVYNVPIFLEAGVITVSCADSLQSTRITGSEAHQEYLQLLAAGAPLERAIQHWKELAADSSIRENAERQRYITRKLDSLEVRYREDVFGRYLRRNSSSPLAMWALNQYWHREGDPEQVLAFLINMPRAMRNSRYLRGMGEMAERLTRSAIGRVAPEFRLHDTLGKEVSLSSFRGKWVLLNFWASWNLNSRLANRELLSAFEQYRNRNFTILSVAVERQKNHRKFWMEAIRDDSLTWTHVTDFKFFDSPVLKDYGLQNSPFSLPFSLLIDPSGKIVARNLRGLRLWMKLDEFLEP